MIPVTIAVSHVNALRQAGYDQIRVYRSETQDGTFNEVSTPATRVPLSLNTLTYTFIDPTGQPDYWYQWTYAGSSGAPAETDPTVPTVGVDSALDVMSVDELKQYYLFGVPQTDLQGNPVPDGLYQHYIKGAVEYLENAIGIAIKPRTITDEKHDFVRRDWFNFAFCQADYYPMRALTRVRIVLPENQQVIDFDTSWFQPMLHSGQIMLLPAGGSTAVIAMGAASAWPPFMGGSYDFLPDVVRVSYTAGWERNQVPADIKLAVGLHASIGPLTVAGNFVLGPGLRKKTIAIDRQMQTIESVGGFSEMIKENTRRLQEMVPQLIRAYRGPRVVTG